MKNPWFRLYAEFAFDPKIQSVTETSQRRFIMLLCLKCDGSLPSLSDEEIAFALRITDEELQETKELLIKKSFIDKDWNIRNWDKRQYKSDKSAERTRRYREKQKTQRHGGEGVTSQKRHSDKAVTPPDTDTDTDTDIKKPPIPYVQIVSYLNEKCGKAFKPDTKETRKAIRARWNEGFRLEDFKRVIGVKCLKWGADLKMQDYLRPQTLFGTKFEAYLNESTANGDIQPDNGPGWQPPIEDLIS